LYRLDSSEQVSGAGLAEYLQPDGVTVIEWAEKFFEAERPVSSLELRAAHFRRVLMEVTGETERRITYEDIGA
jgi:tRNA threonylcarbamoyladenosine biosynthesis protein TsaE